MGFTRQHGAGTIESLSRGGSRTDREACGRKYKGFNDSHLREKLLSEEKITVSRETLRSLLRSLKIRSPQKRRPRKYRARRERKAMWGAMVLADASRHDWLEERGPRLTLLGYMDDATGTVLAVRARNSPELVSGPARHVSAQRHALDTRRRAGWQTSSHSPGARHGRTRDYADRSMSPQAKGRIERLWRTFQDRLTSELRLVKAATLGDAACVPERFVADFNLAFSVKPADTGSAFRKLDRRLDLNRVFQLALYPRGCQRSHHHFRSACHPVASPKWQRLCRNHRRSLSSA